MSELTADAIAKIEALAINASTAEPHPRGGVFVALPEGYRVEHLAPIDAPLSHIKATVQFDDAPSFIDYVNRFKAEETALFASVTRGQIMAVIDYHQDAAAYCAHRAIYTLPHSEQWKRWASIDGKNQPQRTFAEFIEENIIDVVEPDGAALLEVATSLQSTRKVEFHSGVNLGNGTVQLKYTEEDDTKTGKQALTIPQKIKLGIPVYYGDTHYEVPCFFRYRIEDGKLNFQVRIQGRELLVQDAFRHKVDEVAQGTEITVRYGTLNQ
jgi:uncharacterized protein YfdQ (DUF2303 family)